MLKLFQMVQLDKCDKVILLELQQNARMTNAELGKKVHLSPPAVHARIKRLEQAGLIERYVALLDRKMMGYGNLCFISISLQLHQHDQLQDVIERIHRMPEVLECYHLTGESDYLLKVLVKDTESLERLITKQLTPLPGIGKIRTSVVLKEIKVSTAVPVE